MRIFLFIVPSARKRRVGSNLLFKILLNKGYEDNEGLKLQSQAY